MKTWADVQLYIDRHKLPYSIMRFNMARDGRMIDLATGEIVAATVKEAAVLIGDRQRVGSDPDCTQRD
jgi:hypothetical protein